MVRGDNRSIQVYVERACDPSQFEPDLAFNLEIADIINKKKQNTPRDAAVHIVKLINHRNQHVAMLALNLLDICVKNCGYPFHLQISTKEFLNELVKKFPEKPPGIPSPVQVQILQLIHEWKNTICALSKFKDDFVYIRDMHRLLAYKGYRFPNTKPEAAAVMNQNTQLRSADELEEEDRAAQSAKLQELIRRGTPKDLEAANELMKVMAGYDPDQKPDYKKQTNTELDKVQQKAILLNDMLNNITPGERFTGGDVFEELSTACKNVQPKLQKLIGESEDPEATERLLSINDILNGVLERFEKMKTGDFSANSQIDSSTLKTQAGDNLIDFDFGANQTNVPAVGNSTDTAASKAPAKPENIIDDLMGLSFNEGNNSSPWGTGGSIALGGLATANNGASSSNTSPFHIPAQPPLQVPSPVPFQLSTSSHSQSPSPASAQRSSTPSTNMEQPPAYQPNYDPFGATTPANSSSPLQQISNSSHQHTGSAGSHGQKQINNPADDDWGFVSATPAAGPVKEVQLYYQNNLRILLECSKPPSTSNAVSPTTPFQTTLQMKAKFTNMSSTPMTDLTFRLAVPRTLQLKMEAQTSQTLQPMSPDSVTQIIKIGGGTENIRVRYKVTYVHDGRLIDESGQFDSFPTL